MCCKNAFNRLRAEFMNIFIAILIISLIPSLAHTQSGIPSPELRRWDWQSINCSEVSFPASFTFGVATAAYQDGGSTCYPHANWAHWELRAGLEPSEDACGGWKHAHDDIKLLKELGVTAYRFSVDWSRIQPHEKGFDLDALLWYKNFCQALCDAGIKPMVTLHHFVHPMWFESRGGFEKPENIKFFVTFAERVFQELAPYVTWWCTINEPSVLMLQGYLRGVFPPGKSFPGLRDEHAFGDVCSIGHLASGVNMLKNLLMAHVTVYQRLHELNQKYHYTKGKPLTVGLAHSYLAFEQFHDHCAPFRMALEYSVARPMTALLNDTILTFFKTGVFSVSVPGLVNEYWNCPDAPNTLDFIGINYYAHVFLKTYFRLTNTIHPGYTHDDIQTDMPYGIYAEGLFRAIADVAQLQKPIYITENGISDNLDNRRSIWIERYLYALNTALAAGYDVRGYFYWTLLDNWEWSEGYRQKFGLYSVDRHTQTRRLKKGAQWFATVAQATIS